MEQLTTYIQQCISPRNKYEYSEGSELAEEFYNKMPQDGFVICDEKPNESFRTEYVSIGNKYIVKKIVRNIAWFDEQRQRVQFTNSRDPIYRRLIPPPTETVNHVLIIKCFIEELKKEVDEITYVEYGVRLGECLNPTSKIVNKTYGVDIVKRIEEPENCSYYQMTTNEFSEKFLPDVKFNVAFIDADHSSNSAFNDFENIYKHIDVGGYVFLHDTYPCNRNFLHPCSCNDCYKTPLKIKNKYPNIEMLTFPLNPGVTVVRKTAGA